MHRMNFGRFLLYLELALYFAELDFSLSSKQGQRVGLHDQLIWHPNRRVEVDLESKLVKNRSKST